MYDDLSDEEFSAWCKRYARARGRREHAEDFAQEAFLMRRRWKRSTILQMWLNYWRGINGVRGYAKYRVERAVEFRRGVIKNRTKGICADAYEVETHVPAPVEEGRYPMKYLTVEEQMLRLLLEEGFELSEVSKFLRRDVQHELEKLRRKIILSDPELIASSKLPKDYFRRQVELDVRRQALKAAEKTVSFEDVYPLFESVYVSGVS